MLELVLLISICFLIIFKEIAWILLINKQLKNFNTFLLELHKDLTDFNKELNLLKNNLFSKNPLNENITVNNKKISNAQDPNLIKGSQMTGILLERLAEILKEANKLCSTQVKVKAGEKIYDLFCSSSQIN